MKNTTYKHRAVPPCVFRHWPSLLPRVRDWWPCVGLIIIDVEVLGTKHR